MLAVSVARQLVCGSGLLPGVTRIGARSTLRWYATKVDIKALKRLRELNPVPISKAKEALLSTDNDIDQAVAWLEKDAIRSGAKKAEKIKNRVASDGAIAVHVNDTLTAGAIIELGCETDFVARNATFVDLATAIAQCGLELAGRSTDHAALTHIEPNELSSRTASGQKVADTVTETIGRLGENIVLRRAATMGSPEALDSIVVSGYVHGGVAGSHGALAGKIGGLVAIKSSVRSDEHRRTLRQLAGRLAQQVVGYSPRFITVDEWQAASAAGIDGIGEPEVTVLESQQFLFGGGTIAEVLAKVAKGVDAPVEVASFVRFERGEGVEKPVRLDFAEEVRQQLS
ncbi:Elongation factor Ts, mitochondrial [Coemansia aciculifera]|uniref:Elongation factor Ts, mitochondrial n=1 Tax=Coemansia aciculifera TaxID=417176 RepID=A0ACC1M5L4_9FUNG|nr:Elongation factor Ts, mitochondrial [Coemansia aciculifera]